MDMRQIMTLLAPFTGWRSEGRRYRGGETINDKWSYSILLFHGKKRKGQHSFRKGKRACETTLGSCAEGRPEDASTRRCAAAADSKSRATSGLTRGGRQLIGPLGSKDFLGQILLWTSNTLSK
jgi:hypothetical protein